MAHSTKAQPTISLSGTLADRTADGAARPEIEAFAHINGLIGDLVGTLEEENRLLSSGMPASLSSITGVKLKLANEIEAEMKSLFAEDGGQTYDTVAKRELAERVNRTQMLAAENARRLAAAIEASRRRIEAIMNAVREERSSTAPAYGANGRRAENGSGNLHNAQLL